MSGNKISARDFPRVYDMLRIDTNDLGCIMLDVESFDVLKYVENGAEDIFYPADREKHTHLGGLPAEEVAHCTLLYGLLESGVEWSLLVDEVLDGWEAPDLVIESVGFFPGKNEEGEEYTTIVGHIERTPQLEEGNQRRRLLPHIDTFPEYRPHITLAYVKTGDDIRQKWVDALNHELEGRGFPVKGINYGD